MKILLMRLTFMLPFLVWIGAENVSAATVSPSMLKIERFSAERGDAQSQYFLGEHYELADSGVERDLSMALSWYRKAAQQGHAAAQYKIGLFYSKGYAGLKGGDDIALDWYKKAAANGNDAARSKLEEIHKANEEANAAQLQQQEKEAAKEKQRQLELKRQREQEQARVRRASKQESASRPVQTPQKEVKKTEYPPEQTIERLLAKTWTFSGKPAEYLPAEDMNCLKSADKEITCFSHERKRVIKNSKLHFSVKSVLSGFARDGSFVTTYFYNVTDIGKASSGNGASVDSFGLKAKSGWQQPGLTVKCQVKESDMVQCTGRDQSVVKFVAR